MLIKEYPTTLHDAVRKYLHKALGVDPVIQQWPGISKLPYFLQDAYEFHELKIHDLSILLAVHRRAKTLRVAGVRDQMDKLKSLAGRPIVYVTNALASYERDRLIEQKVPFIVPGNQLYLPDLGVDLREYFRQKVQAPGHALSPATQAMLIKALLQKATQTMWQPTAIAAELGYTAMTVSRAVRELTATGIATLQQKGRTRSLQMNSPAETWELAKPLLRSPIREIAWVPPTPKSRALEQDLPLAGLSALARHSQLVEPIRSVYAVDLRKWRISVQQGLETTPEPYVGTFEMQVWSYGPWHDNKTVDPLSLTLSLQNEADERVQSALEELQEHFPW